MSLFDISLLTGKTLDGIDVEEGIVYFDVLVPGNPELIEEFKITPFFNSAPDYIVDIEGDMADLIDTPILEAEYDEYTLSYVVTSELGTVRFSANGPDTVFEAA